MPKHTSSKKVLVVDKGGKKAREVDKDVAKGAEILMKMSKDKNPSGGKLKKKSGDNPWLKHLKAFYAKNKSKMSYKEAMKEAKKTYKK